MGHANFAEPEPLARNSPQPMADFVYDAESHIIIDSKIYDRSALSDEQGKAVAAINFSDQEIARQSQVITVCRMGRDRMVGLLLEDLITNGNEVLSEIDPPSDTDEAA